MAQHRQGMTENYNTDKDDDDNNNNNNKQHDYAKHKGCLQRD